MRRLILLRHAKTESGSASGRDFDRKLDRRGLADAAEIGRWLAEQPGPPAVVLVSPALRAQQTWEIAAKALLRAPEMREVQALYDARVGDLLQAIRNQGGSASPLMLVAHNPGLHELAISLSERDGSAAMRELQENFPTSGIATIDFEIDDWQDAHFQGGILRELVSPKTLCSPARGAP